MINCKYLDINEEILFRSVIEEKYNPGKKILQSITDRVVNNYDTYLLNFKSLERKLNSEFADSETKERNSLQLCYSSPTSSFALLKQLIYSKQPDTLKAFCPYCLIDKPKTLDHYIGQTEFPEYSILVKNLIPCCYDCNQKKGDVWRQNNERRFIHYYTDTFIVKRFLYSRLLLSGSKNPCLESISYYLKKPATISRREYGIIKTHFKDLNLIEEYNSRANVIVSAEITALEQAKAEGQSQQEITKSLKRSFTTKAAKFGLNYWEAVMYDTLASTPKLVNSL